MKNVKLMITAALSLSLAAVSPSFASSSIGGGSSGDTTYYLDGAAGGFSGWIELDSSSGSFTGYPATPSPIVAFDLIAPDPGFAPAIVTANIRPVPEVDFSSANSEISIASSPTPSLTWTPEEITSINLVINDADPQSLDVHFDINGGLDLGLHNGLNLGGPLVSSDTSGYFGAPDAGATWIMLSGASAALAGWQTVVRRRAKV